MSAEHRRKKVQATTVMEPGDLDAVNDTLLLLDKSDTTLDPEGTLKRITVEDALGALGSGTSFTSGSGAPSGGNPGDWYLRTSNMHLYQNVASVWTAMGQLVPIA